MNKLICTISLCFILLASSAQNGNRYPEIDKSGMDMSYFPANYPILKIQNKVTDPPLARIIYSRPQKMGRKIFGELVEYNKVWRLGSNEATEIEFFKDTKINGKKISRGRYTLYAIVTETKWTLILNKDTDTWGAFKYDPKKDSLRVDLIPEKTEEIVEALSIVFEKSGPAVNLVIAWDQLKATLPINF
jgi:hypothetical protein